MTGTERHAHGPSPAGADPGEDPGAPDAGTAADAVDTDHAPDAADGDRAGDRRSLVLTGALLAVLSVPLVVALAALRRPHWYPLLDLAQTELRVRDVGGADTPLVGLAGRIQAYGQQGSHPGPLSFLALAPVYRLLGGTAFALQIASVAVHVVALAGVLAVARRRGGLRLALGVGAVLAVLLHGYGTAVFVEPWNPYMPVLWWVLFLLAAWSVTGDDLAMLPVAVFAGSFCVQTHVSYVGLVGGVAALTVAVVAGRAWPRRHDRAVTGRLARWGGASLALGGVLWLPPVIDQLTNDPGNAAMIVHNFRHSAQDPIGFGTGIELVAVHLNPWRLLTGDIATSGSVLPGLALVAVWAGTVAVARRRRHAPLVRLHVVVAVALVLAVISASRIYGDLWFYLALWAWGIAGLLLLATVWTVVDALGERRRPAEGEGPPRADPGRGGAAWPARLGMAALVAVVAVWTTLFTVDAGDARAPAARQSRLLSHLAPATVDALGAGHDGTGGRDGHYLVTWTDPVAIGASGFGLLLELERQGFDVGVPPAHGTGAVEHRVLPAVEATGEVHLSIGSDIARWQDRPDATQVAATDVRSAAERRRYDELRAAAVAGLRAAGLDDVVPRVDASLMAVAVDERVPDDVIDRVTEMADIGQPAAVFVVPR